MVRVSDFESAEDASDIIRVKKGEQPTVEAIIKSVRAANRDLNIILRQNVSVLSDSAELDFFKWALAEGHIKIYATGRTPEDIHKLYTEKK